MADPGDEVRDVPRATLLSQDSAAKLLKMSVPTLQRLAKAGVIPRAGHGRYEVVSIVHGYIDHLRDKGNIKGDLAVNDTSYSAERAKLTKERAIMATMERQRIAGELVPAAQMEDTWRAFATTVRTRLLAIPSKIAANILACKDAYEAQTLIREQINEALLELSRPRIVRDPPPT